VSVIHRVLDVLHAFTPERPEMSLTSIGRHTGLPLATVHRLVGELVSWGALDRGEDGSYRLTVKIWQLGAATSGIGELSRTAMPALADLYHLTAHQAHLSIIDDTEEVVIASIGGRGPDRAGPSRLPAFTTSAGLVLLAHAPRQVQEQVLSTRPFVAADGDRPSPAALRRVLADVRARGVATCRNAVSGQTTIATAVRDASATVAAAVTATARPDQEPYRLAAAVVTAAADISRDLGYRSAAGMRGSADPANRWPPHAATVA
jgi:DNA-binding IclR family transcriptional regulator